MLSDKPNKQTTNGKKFLQLPFSILVYIALIFALFTITMFLSSIEYTRNNTNRERALSLEILEHKVHNLHYMATDFHGWQKAYAFKRRLGAQTEDENNKFRQLFLESSNNFNNQLLEIEQLDLTDTEKEKTLLIKKFFQEFMIVDTQIIDFYKSNDKTKIKEADNLLLDKEVELLGRIAQTSAEIVNLSLERIKILNEQILSENFYFNIIKYSVSFLSIFLAAFCIYKFVELLNVERNYLKTFVERQKMEAVGRLAGGIAHDFNNLLTVIIGQSDLLAAQFEKDSKQWQRVNRIIKAGQNAAELTGHLLIFSRKQTVKLTHLNINVVINEYQHILQRLIGENIGLVFDLLAKDPFIEANEIQLQQVLMNLVINARDAMPNGGKVIIKTSNYSDYQQKSKSDFLSKRNDYVLLSVSDSGIGMSEEVKSKIFEPFYTTKDEKGSGLGLATVYSIVTQMGGKIDVDSEIELGTTFRLYFPQIASADIHNSMIPLNKESLDYSGAETILLIEDNESVTEFITQALAGYGYNVLTASNGLEAIKIANNSNVKIDLMISDIVMPEMNGEQLAEIILSLKPEMKILFISGYTDGAINNLKLLNKRIPFVQKPFTAEVLAQNVRNILN